MSIGNIFYNINQVGSDIDGEDVGDYSGYSLAMSADGYRIAIGAIKNDRKDENGNIVLIPGTTVTSENSLVIPDGNNFGVTSAIFCSSLVIENLSIDLQLTHPDISELTITLESPHGTSVVLHNPTHGNGANLNGNYPRTLTPAVGDIKDFFGENSLGMWSLKIVDNKSNEIVGSLNGWSINLNEKAFTNSGHVRVYDWNGTSWTQVGEDIDGENADDESGYSVAMSANGLRIAIGAIKNDGVNGTNSGHVRVYDWNGTSWTQVGEDIDGEDADDESGYSVTMSADGSRIAIGAIKNDGVNGTNSGHVRVYDWNGTSWTQVGEDIDGEYAYDELGFSVTMSANGSRIAIGGKENFGETETHILSNSGHVRVYEWNGSAWVKVGEDIDGEASYDRSGYSVAMSADGARIVIGAIKNDGVNGTNSGHVKVYHWNGTSWTQVGSDIDGEATDDESGYSVAMSANGLRIAIGANKNNGADENGNTLNNSGHVRVYDWNGTSWTQVGEDIDGEDADDESGYSVTMSADGSRIAIGAVLNDSKDENGNIVLIPGTGTTVTSSQNSLDIPDENVHGVTGVIHCSSSLVIENLSIDFQLTHLDISELTITLISPEGTSVVLHNPTHGNGANLNGNYPSTLTPVGDIKDFFGENSQGLWSLEMVDNKSDNVGSLNGWSINFNETAFINSGHTRVYKINSVFDQLLENKEKLCSLESSVSSLAESGNTSLQSDMTSLQSDMTSLQSGNTSLQSNMTSLQSDMTSLQSDMTSLQNSVTSLETTLNEIKKAVLFSAFKLNN